MLSGLKGSPEATSPLSRLLWGAPPTPQVSGPQRTGGHPLSGLVPITKGRAGLGSRVYGPQEGGRPGETLTWMEGRVCPGLGVEGGASSAGGSGTEPPTVGWVSSARGPPCSFLRAVPVRPIPELRPDPCMVTSGGWGGIWVLGTHRQDWAPRQCGWLGPVLTPWSWLVGGCHMGGRPYGAARQTEPVQGPALSCPAWGTARASRVGGEVPGACGAGGRAPWRAGWCLRWDQACGWGGSVRQGVWQGCAAPCEGPLFGRAPVCPCLTAPACAVLSVTNCLPPLPLPPSLRPQGRSRSRPVCWTWTLTPCHPWRAQ